MHGRLDHEINGMLERGRNIDLCPLLILNQRCRLYNSSCVELREKRFRLVGRIGSAAEVIHKVRAAYLSNHCPSESDDHLATNDFAGDHERPAFVEDIEELGELERSMLFSADTDDSGSAQIAKLGRRDDNVGKRCRYENMSMWCWWGIGYGRIRRVNWCLRGR